MIWNNSNEISAWNNNNNNNINNNNKMWNDIMEKKENERKAVGRENIKLLIWRRIKT